MARNERATPRRVARARQTSRGPGFFFQAEDCIRYLYVTGVQTCALPISQAGTSLGFDVHFEPPAVDHHLEPADPGCNAASIRQVGQKDVVGAVGGFEAGAWRDAGEEACPFGSAVEGD